ncbi:Protein pob1 [Fusarium oxysporum f. sp. albedinis]|nr:Protein pob1 [Fusarium oxysporum f. sp. albedinis]
MAIYGTISNETCFTTLCYPTRGGALCTDRLGCYFFSGREIQKFGDFAVAGSRREPSLAHSNGVGAFGRTHQDGVDGFLTLWLLAYTPYQWSSFAGMINAEVLCG